MFEKIVTPIGKFSYRFRKVILVAFVVLFALSAFLQSKALISFSNNTETNKVLEVFPNKDTLVLLVDHKDTDKVDALIEWLEKDENVIDIQSYNNTLGVKMTSTEIAEVAGIDASFINTLFYMHENGMETGKLTLVQFINFISNDAFLSSPVFAEMIDDATKASLVQYQSIINGIAQNTAYDANAMSGIFGTPVEQIQGIYQMNGVTEMTIEGFADMLIGMAQMQGGSAPEQVMAMKSMCSLVNASTAYSPSELIAVLPIQSPMFTEDTVSLLYLLYQGNNQDLSSVKISLYDFFMYLSEDVVTNPQFASLLEEDMIATLDDTKANMIDGKAQLVGTDYSRVIITTAYLPDTEEMTDFYTELDGKLKTDFENPTYMVGEGAMGYELSQTFDAEYLLITIVTAVLIFLTICISFRKFIIPALLVCIVECAVFVTMSVMAISNAPMYFIAVIIVQCILMGSMVDYGILMTSYYREVRETTDKENALPIAMNKAIRAIMTSALVVILVTAILGFAMTDAIGGILKTLSIGALSAILLILFVLPSMLSIFDKYIVKKKI